MEIGFDVTPTSAIRQGTGWAGSDDRAGRDGQDAGHTTAGLAEADGGGAAG